ncbi:LOW QUALITY PROTEIN: low-density lipoprotein receptor-related protein 3 [Rhinatrema bivittatum]|uniref:LOW QUALITY PROTEIN: low-density lipoprotein receptor-related protein 3 n=1 Tax=Rhinatrema bivittatum TaxID=194408 RepID=UPI001125D74E|nr:LOW QUALITY PROTEIN: low-density lipoprotein receptor-related protein 3 [Rhinatrema bivittatum]
MQKVAALELLHCAFLQLTVICSAACSGKLEQHTERRGVIYSPSWPLNYPPAMNCSWYIQGDHGDIITISFKNFDMEDSQKCNVDWLMIGPSSKKQEYKVCGSFIPPAFISARDHVWIFFHSDPSSSGQSQGFRLSYIRGKAGQSVCQSDEYLCGNGKCIPRTWKCNSVDECGDDSDEKNCTVPPTEPETSLCPSGTFQCSIAGSTQCLPNDLRCNSVKDCGDGSDEENCPDLSCGKDLGNFYGSFASPDLFHADHGGADLYCTWYVDTQDNRHVILRLDLQLGYSDYVRVYEGTGERGDRLVQTLSYHNNKRPVNVESTTGQLTVSYHARAKSTGHGFNATYQVKGYCLPWEHPCGSGDECFSGRQRCDGWWHCPNGKDEESCPACQKNEYPCEGNSGLCYSLLERCNNQKNCPNGSDEKNCFSCQPGNFHCSTNLCIFETWRCDGQEDCQDGSDEHNCLVIVPRKVITAALIGSLVCGLLLVIALGCAFKLYSLRSREYRAFETQMTRLEADFVRREAPPSYGQLIAQGLIPPVEDFPVYNASQASVLQNIRTVMRRQMRRHTSRRNSSRRRLGRLWSRLFHRPRARGQIPLLTPSHTSQTALSEGIFSRTEGRAPTPAATPEGLDPGSQVGALQEVAGSILHLDCCAAELLPSADSSVPCTDVELEAGWCSRPSSGPEEDVPCGKLNTDSGKAFRDPLSESTADASREGPACGRTASEGHPSHGSRHRSKGLQRPPSRKQGSAPIRGPEYPSCCMPSRQGEPSSAHAACCHSVEVPTPGSPSPLSEFNTSDDDSLLVC